MPRRRPRPIDSTTDIANAPDDTTDDTTEAVVEDAAPAPVSRQVVSDDVGPVETKEEPRPAPKPVLATPPAAVEGVPNGIILEPNEDVYLEGDDDGIAVVVSRDVYRKTYPYGSRRPSYLLLYPRGARVAKTALQKKGKG